MTPTPNELESLRRASRHAREVLGRYETRLIHIHRLGLSATILAAALYEATWKIRFELVSVRVLAPIPFVATAILLAIARVQTASIVTSMQESVAWSEAQLPAGESDLDRQGPGAPSRTPRWSLLILAASVLLLAAAIVLRLW